MRCDGRHRCRRGNAHACSWTCHDNKELWAKMPLSAAQCTCSFTPAVMSANINRLPSHPRLSSGHHLDSSLQVDRIQSYMLPRSPNRSCDPKFQLPSSSIRQNIIPRSTHPFPLLFKYHIPFLVPTSTRPRPLHLSIPLNLNLDFHLLLIIAPTATYTGGIREREARI